MLPLLSTGGAELTRAAAWRRCAACWQQLADHQSRVTGHRSKVDWITRTS